MAEEVIVAFTARATQDVGHQIQASRASIGILDSSLNLTLRRTLVDIDTLLRLGLALVLGVVGNEGTLDLVGVEDSGLLAVGLGDLFLIGIGADLKEVCRVMEVRCVSLRFPKKKKKRGSKNAMSKEKGVLTYHRRSHWHLHLRPHHRVDQRSHSL
jgi:hypothetical protein